MGAQQLADLGVVVLGAVRLLQDHERHDRLTGGLVGRTDDGGLGDDRVRDERRLDLGGREPVARHVHDVVDAAEQPDVAVLVEVGAVAGEVPQPWSPNFAQ